MDEVYTHGIPAMPNSYKLTADAIKALTDLVDKKFYKLMSDDSFHDKVMVHYQKRLDEYMMKQYPDLSNRLNSLALKLDESCKKLEKNLKELNLREKSVVKSENLYEDVYNLRDEFKDIKKFFDEFQKKMKKVFAI